MTTATTAPSNILIIIHAPPYGSERCLSALRLALALAGHTQSAENAPRVQVFLMSDAVGLALPNQQDASGKPLQVMVQELAALHVPVLLCRTCVLARGLMDLPLIDGCRIGTLDELAAATIQADKVLTF